MICIKPIAAHGSLVGCGQCMPCRINRQRVWKCRIMLEALQYKHSTFVTLTYNEEHAVRVAPDDMRTTLSPTELANFIQKLRRKYTRYPQFRYFGCGEYGTGEEQRAHYHLILFGPGLDVEPAVAKAWTSKKESKGFSQVGEFNAERAAYVAQYTLKKMTAADHRELQGRWPEFMRCSKRPGIGARSIDWLEGIQRKQAGMLQLVGQRDVFNSVRLGGQILPLGAFLQGKLRDRMGLPKDAVERELWFDRFLYEADRDPHEFKPKTEYFHPSEDLLDSYATVMGQQRRYAEKKEKEALGLKSDAKRKRRALYPKTTDTIG